MPKKIVALTCALGHSYEVVQNTITNSDPEAEDSKWRLNYIEQSSPQVYFQYLHLADLRFVASIPRAGRWCTKDRPVHE